MVLTRVGGWWLHVLLALGHWCCLAASHHVPSPLLLRSTAVARTLPPISGAVAEAAAISATTVKSQLAHSPLPPPDLCPRFHWASRWVYDIAIRTPTIIDMDFLPQYNPYSLFKQACAGHAYHVNCLFILLLLPLFIPSRVATLVFLR